MPNINVAGIKIAFHYTCSDYFENNIEAYLTKETNMDYTMTSIVVDEIPEMEGKKIVTGPNRYVIEEDEDFIIVNYGKNGKIKEYIRHSKDYKKIEIMLARNSGNNLPEMEYVLTGLLFLELALHEQKLALHGSAINVHGKAVIFSAPSGTGKSTHANHWLDKLPEAFIINDDKPLLYIKDNVPYVCGTPWSGKSKLNTNTSVPLQSIVFLERGTTNNISAMTSKQIITNMLKNVIRPRNEVLITEALHIIEQLLSTTAFLTYQVTKGKDSFLPLYDKLFGGTT